MEVGPGGVVTGWTWVAEPTSKHPFDRPFAFAQIQLDGADTTLLHAVDAGSIDAMSTGMRVVVRYAEERHGAVTDVYFVPGDEAPTAPAVDADADPVMITEHLIGVHIHEPLQPHRQRFLRGLLARRSWGSAARPTARSTCPAGATTPSTGCR
ncbi:MAG: hypothetical protein R2695_13450 [Acidimicrobiales bacterium]